MKKFVAMLLALVMVFALCACGDKPQDDKQDKAAVKVGFICLHDENSTYDKNFIDAAKAACKNAGLSEDQYIIKTNIPENQDCYNAAAELVDAGCTAIFADSFGHEDFMIQAAKEFPEVQFCHSTGTKAHTENLSNFHNAFASIYEGRYLAGVAAGMKLQQLIDEGKVEDKNKNADGKIKIGYVGAYPYAEVVSGYTAFFLGLQSIVPDVAMQVQYTNSWFNITAENEAAKALIADGCIIISQHADSMGAPTACETAGVPNVSYNGSTVAACPNTFIVSSRINWEPYFEYILNCMMNGEDIALDWTGTIATGSVELSAINEQAAAAGTAEKLEEVKAALAAGTIKVFDTTTFTVNGEALTSYLADVDDMGDFVGDTEVVIDGEFKESFFRAAPYFDLNIDGITLPEGM